MTLPKILLLRLLPLVFLFIATTASAQHDPFSSFQENSKWYMGGGLGKAIPKILLNEAVTDVTLDIPDELGGGEVSPPISVNSEFATYGQKVFVGYDVGEENHWALEGSIMNFGKYRGTAKTTVSASGTSPEGIPYTISGEGEESLTADIYGLTFSTIYSFQLGKRFSIFPRIGVAYVKGTIEVEENVNISVSVPGQNMVEAELERESNTMRGLLPVVGIGVDVQITERSFIRTEFERYGHPTKEPYIDTVFISWGYKFK